MSKPGGIGPVATTLHEKHGPKIQSLHTDLFQLVKSLSCTLTSYALPTGQRLIAWIGLHQVGGNAASFTLLKASQLIDEQLVSSKTG